MKRFERFLMMGVLITAFLALGAIAFAFAQTIQVVLLPGESIEVVCATSEPCPTCSPLNTPIPTATEVPPTSTPEPTNTNTPEPTSTDIPPTVTDVPPTSTIEPTATNTAEPTATPIPPTPTNTPQPAQTIRFGPMDLTANGTYADWSDVFDLARDFHYPDQAIANGYTLIVPVILSHSRCMTDGVFDYTKCRAEVLRVTAQYADVCRGEDCVWYVYDEPHDPRESNPTYSELDGMCQAAKSVLDVPCGYNAPAEWMAVGAPYQYVDMSLSQTNFGHATSEAAWASWANATMDAARTFADTIYLSFNSETYEPTAADYAEAMAGICSAHPDGVTFWSFRMPHTQETMTHSVALNLRQVCEEARK